MDSEKEMLAAALKNVQEPCHLYTNWLAVNGRSVEAELWRRPQSHLEWFRTSVSYTCSFYGAFFDPEIEKINWDKPIQQWMKPVKRVFAEDEGDEDEDIPWIALLYYDDGLPSPFMFVEAFADYAGWMGQSQRFESLKDAVSYLSDKHLKRFSLQ